MLYARRGSTRDAGLRSSLERKNYLASAFNPLCASDSLGSAWVPVCEIKSNLKRTCFFFLCRRSSVTVNSSPTVQGIHVVINKGFLMVTRRLGQIRNSPSPNCGYSKASRQISHGNTGVMPHPPAVLRHNLWVYCQICSDKDWKGRSRNPQNSYPMLLLLSGHHMRTGLSPLSVYPIFTSCSSLSGRHWSTRSSTLSRYQISTRCASLF